MRESKTLCIDLESENVKDNPSIQSPISFLVRVECMGVLCFTHRIQWYNCCGDSRDAR